MAHGVVLIHRGIAGRVHDADQSAEPVVDVGDIRMRGVGREDQPKENPADRAPRRTVAPNVSISRQSGEAPRRRAHTALGTLR